MKINPYNPKTEPASYKWFEEKRLSGKVSPSPADNREKEEKWTSIEGNYPKKLTNYLVATKNGGIFVDKLVATKTGWDWSDTLNVTHFKPLPKHPTKQ